MAADTNALRASLVQRMREEAGNLRGEHHDHGLQRLVMINQAIQALDAVDAAGGPIDPGEPGKPVTVTW